MDLGDLDASAVLAAASVGVRARRLAEVHELEVLARWAVLHSADPLSGPDGGVARVTGNRLVQLGGEGTPGVQDHCLGEIALARETSDPVTTNLIADVLDLQHRLPRTWSRVVAGECEVFVARKVARMSRHLPLDRVGVVDRAVAVVIGRWSTGRVLGVAEAKVVEADPDLHDARVEAEARRRYASLGRRDDHGLRSFVARLEAGDAMWLDATIARVAGLITARHPDAGVDELRSIALGMLARPAEVFTLLCEHTTVEQDEVPGVGSLVEVPDEGGPRNHASNRALAFPADLLDALRNLDLTPLAPKATLYVHLHEAALTGRAVGVARVEGVGPVTLTAVQGLLARTDVTIRPVLDLSDRVSGIAYEFPESVKERVHLRTGGDYWPWATSTSRRCDYDHAEPYIPPDRERSTRRPVGADEHGELRATVQEASPVEDRCRLPLPPVRTSALRLAHPPRAGVPHRPPRHPRDPTRPGRGDPRRTRRSRPLLHLKRPVPCGACRDRLAP